MKVEKIYKCLQILVLIIIISLSSLASDQLVIHFLDVGQADSIFIQLPNGQNMLIDAGNNADGPFVVNYLQDHKITKIDYLIGTHPHEDHIGGIDDVTKSFNIGHIYMPPVTHTTRTFKDILTAFQANNKKIIPAKAGLTIIDQDNLKACFLSPLRDNYKELNEWSAVLKLRYKEISFLFTGDAEEINEIEIISSPVTSLDSDVLKVGHHGSDSSTSIAFVKAVTPSYAVISVGKDNRYDHPSPDIIDRLEAHGAIVLRTDELGTIIARSDGTTLKFYKLIQLNTH